MLIGNNRIGVDLVLDWARTPDAVVVPVEYRRAPEHPYPAPVEDVCASLLRTVEHAEELGGDPDRVIGAGTSAGGGLTAAMTLLARDRKGPQPTLRPHSGWKATG
ncbi:alpha/beta hydrolase [Streptomyces sp. NPDC048282]|uniref:alpha/beta hydrolase n=1 Tax=unclassified Streptomyces TaxID=2593676 RepID=UPI003724B3F8